jgi:hypothetical protein
MYFGNHSSQGDCGVAATAFALLWRANVLATARRRVALLFCAGNAIEKSRRIGSRVKRPVPSEHTPNVI